MKTEFFENTVDIKRGKQMKVIQVSTIPLGKFQAYLMASKTMRAKLALCFKKLSEQGVFSDAPQELFDFKDEIMEHLPEELKNE